MDSWSPENYHPSSHLVHVDTALDSPLHSLGQQPKCGMCPCASDSARLLLTLYSKHILNAQVAIRSPCCRKWFECAECHAESQDHPLAQALELIFACKKCKKCFRKDMKEFEDSDEYCPHCDNHFVLEAVEPKAALQVEGEDARVDARMLKDERVRGQDKMTIFDVGQSADRLG